MKVDKPVTGRAASKQIGRLEPSGPRIRPHITGEAGDWTIAKCVDPLNVGPGLATFLQEAENDAQRQVRWAIGAPDVESRYRRHPTNATLCRTNYVMLDIGHRLFEYELTEFGLAKGGSGQKLLDRAATEWSARLDDLECDQEANYIENLRNDGQAIEVEAAALMETFVRLGAADRNRRAADLAAKHLLPRYALGRTAKAFWRRWKWLWAVAFAALLVLAAVTLVRHIGADDGIRRAATFAGGAYLVAVLAALVFGTETLHPMAMRLPAGGAVGMVGLLSTSSWLEAEHPWRTTALLLLAFLGYSCVECRNHVPHWFTSLRRAMVATVLALVHGCAVAVIVLATVGRQLWSKDGIPPTYKHSAALVAFAGSLSVVLGTFIQVLWSDRTILSPLDRTQWKGR